MKNDTNFSQQLTLSPYAPSLQSCAFTGHRTLDEEFSTQVLREAVQNLVKRGVNTFYCGMAKGFDMLAAECVLACKKEWKEVKLIACIPCYGQEKRYSEEDKKRYAEILKKADEIVYVSEQYDRGCMFKRDRYMADNADTLIAYCKKTKGGTAYTVRYFTEKYPLKEKIFL